MYVLVCREPLVNNACLTGFETVLLTEITPQYMTLAQFQEIIPYTLVFWATCFVWRELRKQK